MNHADECHGFTCSDELLAVLAETAAMTKPNEAALTFAVITDITDSRKMELTLADSERKFRNLFESRTTIM